MAQPGAQSCLAVQQEGQLVLVKGPDSSLATPHFYHPLEEPWDVGAITHGYEWFGWRVVPERRTRLRSSVDLPLFVVVATFDASHRSTGTINESHIHRLWPPINETQTELQPWVFRVLREVDFA